jgi:hypothetical protein
MPDLDMEQIGQILDRELKGMFDTVYATHEGYGMADINVLWDSHDDKWRREEARGLTCLGLLELIPPKYKDSYCTCFVDPYPVMSEAPMCPHCEKNIMERFHDDK